MPGTPVSRWASALWLAAGVLILAGPRAPAYAASGQTFELQDALDLRADPEHGRALYATCATCHQADGRGDRDQDIPEIAGQHYRVLLEQLAHFRAAERSEPRMAAIAAGHLPAGPQDLADVAAYVAALQPPALAPPGGSSTHAAGQARYARACSRCHDSAGQGQDRLRVPRLAGQHPHYLALQMQALASGERIKRSWDHRRLLAPLTARDIDSIAGFLAELPATRGQGAP